MFFGSLKPFVYKGFKGTKKLIGFFRHKYSKQPPGVNAHAYAHARVYTRAGVYGVLKAGRKPLIPVLCNGDAGCRVYLQDTEMAVYGRCYRQVGGNQKMLNRLNCFFQEMDHARRMAFYLQKIRRNIFKIPIMGSK